MNRSVFDLIGVVLVLSLAAGGAYYWITQTPEGTRFWYVTVLGETALEHAARHADAEFTCPMHPEIVTDRPGECPVCGMELVPVAEARTDERAEERRILYYRHPHDPMITSPEPRKDEMGMDFIPVYADEMDERDVVRIRPEVMQNMNIRTARVESMTLERKFDAFGLVEYDEERIGHIHNRVEGWIERLIVQAVGERVRPGQAVFEIYSPTLVNAQEELLQAVGSGREPLIRASRQRLRALGLTPAFIEEIERTGEVRWQVPIHTHHGGIVTELGVRHGMYVAPDTEIMAVADLSVIWVIADVFERQADWIRVGDPAEVRIPFRPGNQLEGTVDYIYPDLNRKTRTVPVRLRFDNADELFKPGMYASVRITADPRPDVLAVPRAAVIRTGRQARVITHLGEGRFQAREVRTGMVTDEHVEILAGLQGGDEVVISGQFLIDSEARVRDAVLRLEAVHVDHEPVAVDPETVSGIGVVNRIDADKRRVNLHHEPIQALGWPAMTMDFRVAPEVVLDAVMVGDEVRFEMRREPDADGMYVITAFEPMIEGEDTDGGHD